MVLRREALYVGHGDEAPSFQFSLPSKTDLVYPPPAYTATIAVMRGLAVDILSLVVDLPPPPGPHLPFRPSDSLRLSKMCRTAIWSPSCLQQFHSVRLCQKFAEQHHGTLDALQCCTCQQSFALAKMQGLDAEPCKIFTGYLSCRGKGISNSN